MNDGTLQKSTIFCWKLYNFLRIRGIFSRISYPNFESVGIMFRKKLFS